MRPAPVRAALVAALCVAALVCLPERAAAQLFSPGTLSRAHKELDGDDACGRCHERGRGVSEAGCLGCHKAAAEGIRRKRGYHYELIKKSGKGCGSCHSDHHGRDFPLIRWDPKTSGFHHTETGYALSGAHARVDCKGCHKIAGHRYMGLSTRCAACHSDPHEPSLGGGCEACHVDTSFRPAPGFDHGRSNFPLDGRHTMVPCDRCHFGTGANWRFRGLVHASCDDCHADPHAGGMAPRPCVDCHDTSGFRTIRGERRATHAPDTFPLEGAHRNVPCAKCHPIGASPDLAPTRCASCHRGPHGPGLQTACGTCHDARSWTAGASGRMRHDRTTWPLKGRHARVACAKCHRTSGSFRKRFRSQAFERCSDCHADPHRVAWATVPDATLCEACHTDAGFVPSTFGAADHGAARFALHGAHLAVPCAWCHRAPPGPGEGAAPLRLQLAHGGCDDCHQNPHDAQFMAAAADPRCAACHSTTSWAGAAFDHATTAFPLRGAHAAAACASCHIEREGPSPAPFAKLETTCRSCHGDPHLGQFAGTAPAKTCGACHGEVRWKDHRFDHQTGSRFPLEGRHVDVPCARCHERRRTDHGEIVIYRHGRTACAACHANAHERRDGRGGLR